MEQNKLVACTIRNAILLVLASVNYAYAASERVNIKNYVRAETDFHFKEIVKMGGFGKFIHRRDLVTAENQKSVRLNTDTLYSVAVVDLNASPAVITIKRSADRFVSMQVIDQDHYTSMVKYGDCVFRITREEVLTRYALIIIRIGVDSPMGRDIAFSQSIQDAVELSQSISGVFSVPNWDETSLLEIRSILQRISPVLSDTKKIFGKRGEVNEAKRLIGAAFAWGGQPEADVLYLNVSPPQNDGKTVYRLAVGDVPVRAFWSISVYNKDGYLHQNPEGAYSINSFTAKRSRDGTIFVQFGGCSNGSSNCLPITSGWNYMVRFYRPEKILLNDEWSFPHAEPIILRH